MDASRLKNIVIIVLVLINLCFASLIIINRYEAGRIEEKEKKELSELYETNGIELSVKSIPGSLQAIQYTLERDRSEENKIAESFLGQAEETDHGGNIVYYENEKGYAVFRSGGEFEIVLKAAGINQNGNETAEELIKKLGGDIELLTDAEYSDTDTELQGVYLFKNGRVMNCVVTVKRIQDGGVSVSGRRINGIAYQKASGYGAELSTVLVRFLAELRLHGYVCNKIESIELCYIMNTTEANTLDPVWRIVTDGDCYLINAYSEKLIIQKEK